MTYIRIVGLYKEILLIGPRYLSCLGFFEGFLYIDPRNSLFKRKNTKLWAFLKRFSI